MIAPDLIGFGRSDKPVKLKDLSYAMQVDMIAALLEELDLDRITLFCQDWGGLIGLMVAAENEERFDRIVAANTFFPGFPEDRLSDKTRKKVTEMSRGWIAFAAWLAWSQTAVDMPVGLVIQMGTVSKLPKEVVAAYNAPFPNYRYKAAPRVYPSLTGTQLERNERAWQVFVRWGKPFLTAFSDKDPMMYGAEAIYQELIPGAKGQPHTTIRGASHFLQEEKGEELAEVILEFIALTK